MGCDIPAAPAASPRPPALGAGQIPAVPAPGACWHLPLPSKGEAGARKCCARSQALPVTSVPVTGTIPAWRCAAHSSLRTRILRAGTGAAGPGGLITAPFVPAGRRGEALTSAREEFLNAIQASLARLANCVLCNSCSWAPRPPLRVGGGRVRGQRGPSRARAAKNGDPHGASAAPEPGCPPLPCSASCVIAGQHGELARSNNDKLFGIEGVIALNGDE